MRPLHNIVICLQYKFLNRNLLSFHRYDRHFSLDNCCTRKKMEAVNFVTFQRELKIQGYRRFTNISSLTSVNASFSKMKYTSFNTGTELSGQYKTSSISCPTSYMRTGSQGFFSGKHILKYQKNVKDTDNFDECDDEPEDFEDEEYGDMVKRVLHLPEMGHQVLVVQPYVKWGSAKKRSTTPELQLAEAVALIGTLQRWKVVDKVKIALYSLGKKSLFGTGNLEMLKKRICKDKQITAVFISTDILRGIQHRELEEVFGVPVYDRYMVVIQIFREHAITKEAKLQIAMAEIPYLRMRIKGLVEGAADHHGGGVSSIGGAGETHIEIRRRLLNTREMKLKRMLEKVRNQRTLLRNRRQRLEYPVIAVVGYTNAGKTSLIKALTGERELEPKDHLFATLDVTVHAGILPSRLKVLYVDTVGFISDIPSNLIESFVATLEDAMLADVVVHVCDVSHPDYRAQAETVTSTLRSLHLSSHLLDNILVVGNKTDLLPEGTEIEDLNCDVLVSSVTNQGLDDLVMQLNKTVLKATGRHALNVRVLMGGEEVSRLMENCCCCC
ncbi:putative GTP-binding protein 6 isoform X2 [Cryptotermes secundus]|uniref:putative GTP-binding protein 6 isoform X2 n=1 Tax=Cryptotermes secundus TaxID=105785 RepID=UPI000CD7B3C3|nr:putative GTP-binding protein 6 isoform X2 [Cryptotermes secundus]